MTTVRRARGQVVLWLGLVTAGCASATAPAPASSAPTVKAPVPDGVTVVAENTPSVGALFAGGRHFCTGGVVGPDLVVTAAHCVSGAQRRLKDVTFVPGYRHGAAPLGSWQPVSVVVATGWVKKRNPDLDVAFLRIAPLDGRHLGDVTGMDRPVFGSGYRHTVRITGYPKVRDQPVSCTNKITKLRAGQMRIRCPDLTAGISGSPWRRKSRPSEIVGVLGGYLGGGNTPDVSYAAYFGDAVRALYARALRPGT